MTDQPATNRMLVIAGTLGELYRNRSALSLREYQLNQDAEMRLVYITPADGWPGKNAEQRDTACKAAEYQDETLQKIAAELITLKADVSRDDAIIASLEAERRALEWMIRARLVDALSANRIQTDGDAKIEIARFDDVIDAKSLAQAEAAIAEVDAEMSAEADEDESVLAEIRDQIAAQKALFDDDLPF